MRYANNLKPLRQRAGWTLDKAAEAIGISRGGYIKIERGENRLTSTTIANASRAFGVPESDIVASPQKPIPVMGQVGAGAEIFPEFEQVPSEGLFEIEAGITLPDGMIGLEVIGDSMYPRYDEGDVIICRSEGTPPKDLVPGEEAAVRTLDGRRFLKRVRPSAGGFTLESHNAPPIYDIGLEWASEVWTVVRRSKWRKLNSSKERIAKARASRRC